MDFQRSIATTIVEMPSSEAPKTAEWLQTDAAADLS
jgi:hypothetical protein